MNMNEPSPSFMIDVSIQRIVLTVIKRDISPQFDPVSEIYRCLLPILDNAVHPFDGIISIVGIGEINETTYRTAVLYCGFSQHKLIQRIAIIGTGPLLKQITEFIARVSNKGNDRVRSFSTKEEGASWLDREKSITIDLP